MSNKENGKTFVIGAVAGGILGALTALLLAPKAGRELREDISDRYGKLSEKTVEIAGAVSEKTVEIAGAVSEKTQELAKTVSVQTGEIAGKVKEVAGVVVSEVRSWSDGRKESVATLEAAPVTVSASKE